jgi:Na+/H+ antiporter NhaD/arsenite permease-like protein
MTTSATGEAYLRVVRLGNTDVEDTLRRVKSSVLLVFGALFATVGGLEASGVLGLTLYSYRNALMISILDA